MILLLLLTSLPATLSNPTLNVHPNFLNATTLTILKSLISTIPPTPGPSVMDLTMGYVRSPGGVKPVNWGEVERGAFQVYYDTVNRIRERVREDFEDDFNVGCFKGEDVGVDGGLSSGDGGHGGSSGGSKNGTFPPYLTSPTFLTRIVHSPNWYPQTIHDVYYQIHADKNNTDHYDYSTVLYLTTGNGRDFEGGEFNLYDWRLMPDPASSSDFSSPLITSLTPTSGTLITFPSNMTYPHAVGLVRGGVRDSMANWFTVDEGKDTEGEWRGRRDWCRDNDVG